MQTKIGYSLVDDIGNEIQYWGLVPPPYIKLKDGTVVHGVSIGTLSNGYKIVERWLDDTPTTPYDMKNGITIIFDGTKVTVTQQYQTPDLATVKNEVKSKISNYRYNAEVAGTTYANNIYATDATAQGKISQLVNDVLLSQNINGYTVNYKTLDNEFVTLNGNDVINLSKAIRSHVQSCFDKEAEYFSVVAQTTDMNQLLDLDISVHWPVSA
jgi:hypothetical protein